MQLCHQPGQSDKLDHWQFLSVLCVICIWQSVDGQRTAHLRLRAGPTGLCVTAALWLWAVRHTDRVIDFTESDIQMRSDRGKAALSVSLQSPYSQSSVQQTVNHKLLLLEEQFGDKFEVSCPVI